MLRAIIVEPQPGEMADVAKALVDTGQVEVVGYARDGLEVAQMAATSSPDVAVMPSRLPGMDVARACGLLVMARPGTWPIVISEGDEGGELTARVMLAGARAVVGRGDHEALASTVAQLSELSALRDSEEFELVTDPDKMPTVVTLTSAKGGVGKTTLAVNLAVCLSRAQDGPVVLIDSFAQLGDAAVALDLTPRGTIADLIARADGLDIDLVLSYLTEHSSGLKVLAGPAEPLSEPPSTHFWAELVSLLRQRFRFIVLDCPAMPWPSSEYVFSRSNLVLLVTTPSDVINVRNTALLYRYLTTRSGLSDRLHVVINQVDRADALEVKDVERACGVSAFATIPYAPDPVREAANQGVPVVEMHASSEVSKAIRRLCERVVSARNEHIPQALVTA